MWQNTNQNLKFLSIEKYAFGCLGIDIEAPVGRRIVKRPVWLAFLIVFTAMWAILMGCYIKHYIAEDVGRAAEGFSVFIPCFVAASKVIPVVLRGSKFARLIRNLRDLTEIAKSRERKIWITENQHSKRIASIYMGTVCVTLALYFLKPIVVSLGIYIKTGEVVLMPPTVACYLYEHNRPIWIMFTYVLLLPLAILNTCGYIAVDLLFCWCIHNLGARFRILHLKLEYAACDLVDGFNRMQFQRSLKEAINYHCRTIALAHECKMIFREIIFGVFLFNCLHMCVYMYLLPNTMQLVDMPLLMAFLVVSGQLVIYAFGGEKLQSESDISTEVYLMFPWDRISPAIRRQLLLPMMCSQRKCMITGYLFAANRELLLKFLKMAFSFTALLTAMNNNKNTSLQ